MVAPLLAVAGPTASSVAIPTATAATTSSLFTASNFATAAGVGSAALQGISSIQAGRDANAIAGANAQQTMANAFANAESLQQVSGLQNDVTMAIAGLNSQALVDMANFNADQILETAKINSFFQWFGAEYQVAVTKYNEQIALNNSEIAMTNANLAQEQALYNSARINEQNQRIIGEQKAGFAKSGVVIDGSAYDVMYDTAVQASRERLLAETSGDLLAYSFQVEALNHYNDALFLNSQAKAQRLEGYMESAFSLYQGQQQAEAVLFEGYTAANIKMTEAGLVSSLNEFSTQQEINAILREGASLAEIQRLQGEAAESGGLIKGVGNIVGGIGEAIGDLF